MKKLIVWKKAVACAAAAAFLLSACGASSASKSESVSEEPYAYTESVQSAGSAANSPKAAYETNDYETGDYEEADYDMAEGDVAIDDDMGTPLVAASAENAGGGDAARKTSEGQSQGQSEGGAEQADLESSNRKIVYTGNISLQTLEYEKSAQSIHDKITKYGGFIESEDTYNDDPYWYYSDRTGAAANRTRRNLSMTARIPAEKFDAFMKDLENDGQVTNTSVNAQNISVAYATREASKKALEIEQKRLLEMMEKAETVEDMIAVEKRLTQVERELNEDKTKLSAMDRDVNFSTVYISLQEVFEYSEKVVEVTYGERLQRAFGRAIEGFVTFWQDLILFIVETFPFLIMLAVIIALLVRFLRRRSRRKAEKRAAMEEMRRAAARQEGAGFRADSVSGAVDPSGEKHRGRGFFHRRKAAAPADPEVFRNDTAEPGKSGEAAYSRSEPAGSDDPANAADGSKDRPDQAGQQSSPDKTEKLQ